MDELNISDAVTTAQDINCPSCEAVIRNARIQPGVKLRCLNCGAKFHPHLPGQDAAAAEADAPSRRAPSAAGYWLLRIPGIVLCALALLCTALMMVFSVPAMFRYGFGISELTALSYMPLLPWAGLLLLMLTRSLGRIEHGGVMAAWRAGSSDTLPAPPGSSLPYFGPLAVIGGIMPVVLLVNSSQEEVVLTGGLVGAGLFFLGFALADLRQFVWRQQALAKSCCEASGVDTRSAVAAHPRLTGWMLGSSFAFVGAGIIVLSVIFQWWGWEDKIFSIFLGTGSIVTGYSLLLIGQSWDDAVYWWRVAAGASIARRNGRDTAGGAAFKNALPASIPSISMWWVSAIPSLWTLYCLLYVAGLYLNGEFRFARDGEMLGVWLLWIGVGCFAVWMSTLLAQCIRWRRAQQTVWKDEIRSGPSSALSSVMFLGALVAAGVECALFCCMVLTHAGSWQPQAVFGFPILVLSLHFPAVWLAFLLREFLTLEDYFAASTAAEEN